MRSGSPTCIRRASEHGCRWRRSAGLDIQLPFTISTSAAQRRAGQIELMRRRQQGTGTFSSTWRVSDEPALGSDSDVAALLGWTE